MKLYNSFKNLNDKEIKDFIVLGKEYINLGYIYFGAFIAKIEKDFEWYNFKADSISGQAICFNIFTQSGGIVENHIENLNSLRSLDGEAIKDLVIIGEDYIENEGITDLKDFTNKIREDFIEYGFDNENISDTSIRDYIFNGAVRNLEIFKINKSFNDLVNKNLEAEIKAEINKKIGHKIISILTDEQLTLIQLSTDVSLNHAIAVINQAKDLFGNSYFVLSILDYLEQEYNSCNITLDKRMLYCFVLELDLNKQVINNPENDVCLLNELEYVELKNIELQLSSKNEDLYCKLKNLLLVSYDFNTDAGKLASTCETVSKREVFTKLVDIPEYSHAIEELTAKETITNEDTKIYSQQQFDEELQKAIDDRYEKDYQAGVFERIKRQAKKEYRDYTKEQLDEEEKSIIEQLRKLANK